MVELEGFVREQPGVHVAADAGIAIADAALIALRQMQFIGDPLHPVDSGDDAFDTNLAGFIRNLAGQQDEVIKAGHADLDILPVFFRDTLRGGVLDVAIILHRVIAPPLVCGGSIEPVHLGAAVQHSRQRDQRNPLPHHSPPSRM